MSELLDEIAAVMKRESCGHFLSDEGASQIIDRIADIFVEDRDARWWWASLKVPVETLGYGSDDHSLHLRRLLAPRNGPYYLVITDDGLAPWPIVLADLDGVITVLQETWFFEYFLCDASCQWVIFDNHHNCLISAWAVPRVG